MSCYAGPVVYLPQPQIEQVANDVGAAFLRCPEGDKTIECLLIKREAFDHEKEIRLVYRADSMSSDPQLNNDIYQFDFDPLSTLDEITFDPRLLDSDYQTELATLKTKYGYTGIVNKSDLYDIPKLNLSI